MADQDIFKIRGINPSLVVPAYGGSGITGSTYAANHPDCSQATYMDADDFNFIIDNLRRLVVGCGIDISLPEVVEDPTLVLRAVQQCTSNAVIGGGNQAQAYSDTFLLPENTVSVLNVLANDNFDNRDQLTVTAINDTAMASGDTIAIANGSIRLQSDGLLEFTPTTDFTGTTGFIYEATDLQGVVSAALCNITVFDVPAPVPEPTLEIIAIRHKAVSWAPPTWDQMTEFTPAELATAIDGNTVNLAKLMGGSGNVGWLAFEVNMPIVLKQAIFHPSTQWTTGQYRNVASYFNFMLGSDDGQTFGVLKTAVNNPGRTGPHTCTIDISDTGGGVITGGSYPSNANDWKTFNDASVQRTKFMKAFNYTDGAELVRLSNITLVV